MKNGGTKSTSGVRPRRETRTTSSSNSLQQQIEHYKKENDVLLSLSSDLTKVREKSDLIRIFSSSLRSYFEFTHAVISLIDEDRGIYYPFLLDAETHPSRLDPDFKETLVRKNPITDPFLQKVLSSGDQVSLCLNELLKEKELPLFIRTQQKAGIKFALVTLLHSQMKTIGFVYISTTNENGFSAELMHILQRIAPHLSNAVTNVLINDEIHQKDEDKTFLIQFSQQLASARTRKELSEIVHSSLKQLAQVKAYFIRTLDEGGRSLSPFMHDEEVYYKNDDRFRQLLNTRISASDGLSGRVLSGNTAVWVDFEEEIRLGHTDPYIDFWKSLGENKLAFKKMVGIPLRFGEKALGILWVITDEINITLLDGISAQVAVAISNILNYQAITERDAEKSLLLSMSDEIAALRSREDLLHVVNTRIKALFHVDEFGIAQIAEDRRSYSAFVLDLDDKTRNHSDFKQIVHSSYDVDDPLFSKLMKSDEPVLIDVSELSQNNNVPAYVDFWKKAGVQRVVAMRLRVGGKNIGCAFLHFTVTGAKEIKTSLLKAVCAHLSVAIANILSNEKLLAYKKQLEVENDYLKEQIKTIYNFGEIVGNGSQMQKVYHLMSLVAESVSTVLILGETGTGKELIARAIHSSSPRKSKLMIKVNCAALPPNLIESELFGHEKGAFTGAIERRIGKFEMANGSTIFLDEIGEMPLETQVKLLRVLQERELERVGGKTTIKVDVRIVAATNRNLENEVKAGRFRSDLYYRLNVFPITLPSLRDRPEDIVPLAEFFLERYSKNYGKKINAISDNCKNQLIRYQWPGNVRELEHLVERSVLLSDGSILNAVPLPVSESTNGGYSLDQTGSNLQQIEREHIVETLKRCRGKISGNGGAASLLGIPATTLHSKMRKFAIQKSDYFN